MLYDVQMAVTGTITRQIEAKSAEEARTKAKRRYEELFVPSEEYDQIDDLSYGDVDTFPVREADTE